MERWVAVVGHEGWYEVSTLGRVRSISRDVLRRGRGTVAYQGVVLKTWLDRDGYVEVSLCREGRQRTQKVHTLVAASFLGPKPAGTEIAHGDGDKTNCSVDNLRYATPAENSADRKKHGTQAMGREAFAIKLSADDVAAIRSSKDGQRLLAARFGVTRGNVQHVQKGKSWRHV